MILAIDELHDSEVDRYIHEKAYGGRPGKSQLNHWYELNHAAGRLLSYLRAVETLISIAQRWRNLFNDFEVKYVLSGAQLRVHLPNKYGSKGCSGEWVANDIIGCMSSDAAVLETQRSNAKKLQKINLDGEIRKEFDRMAVKPSTVHAEILLLSSIEREAESVDLSRLFYNGDMYIACSKPTCLLCDAYIKAHPSGVQVQQSHKNIYSAWRPADVYRGDSATLAGQRETIMNKMRQSLIEQCFQLLDGKVPTCRPHDTSTSPSYLRILDSDNSDEEAVEDDLTSMMGNFGFGDGDDDDDDDDDTEGGATLSGSSQE